MIEAEKINKCFYEYQYKKQHKPVGYGIRTHESEVTIVFQTIPLTKLWEPDVFFIIKLQDKIFTQSLLTFCVILANTLYF